MIKPVLNIQQKAAINLIRNDMRYIYTVFKNIDRFESNYITSAMPFIGLIIDGAEDWVKAYNKSSETPIAIPTFTKEEEHYYEEMRSSIKMWDDSYLSIKAALQNFYKASNDYFASISSPQQREMGLYNIFGADKADGKFCGNTILCSYYIPGYKYEEDNGEYIKLMSEVMGKYIVLFGAMNEYQINNAMKFTCDDYGGIIESPVGNVFSDNFILFSILCQIQFVLYCVEQYIVGECSTKLRFAYLQYYYCLGFLEEINSEMGTDFQMDNSWWCDEFRNAMAHYKVGVALKPEEIKADDLFYGMVQKFFGCSYFELKQAVLDNLNDLADQIKLYLHIDG